MDKEIEVVALEDNLDYVILMELSIDNNKYMVLSREDDPNVVVVRKIINGNNKEYLVKVSKEVEDKVASVIIDNPVGSIREIKITAPSDNIEVETIMR